MTILRVAENKYFVGYTRLQHSGLNNRLILKSYALAKKPQTEKKVSSCQQPALQLGIYVNEQKYLSLQILD